MKIGHYIFGRDNPGGEASYIGRISEAQRCAGHEVVSLNDPLETPGRLRQVEEMGLDVLHLHTSLDPRIQTRLPMVRTMHGHWPYCPSGSRYLKRSGVACERAYGMGGCLWGHFADRCGSVRPGKLIGDFRRTWNEMSQPRQVLTLAISEFVKHEMIRSGHRADRVRVLHLPAPNVLAPEPLSQENAVAVFLFLGRLVPEKGLRWLLRSFARTGNDAQLEIAGDGPDLTALVELAHELEIAQRVRFLGWLDLSEVTRHIVQARAVIVPSVWHEPAGLVTLEAAAVGRAAIVSRVGGIPEYAAGLGNCVIVEPNDVPSLAEAIDRLASDRQRAVDLGDIGSQNAQNHFGIRAHLAQLELAYHDAKSMTQ
jgi:glycosyltransferase involved in cell wall biosynthesis